MTGASSRLFGRLLLLILGPVTEGLLWIVDRCFSATGASTRLTFLCWLWLPLHPPPNRTPQRLFCAAFGVAVFRPAWNRQSKRKKIIQQVVSELGNDYNFSVLSTAPVTNRTSRYSVFQICGNSIKLLLFAIKTCQFQKLKPTSLMANLTS
ncbi:hypothetical protein M9H77_08316 [Catharanthus roseus]|uniref:Uncharacterized protein n=1 Tax=Catharanthus roseus TaxID=4058 RepID=A0ACC0BXR9_CATRO|nr:hypothetical protein M9H77_08316 [Catharanthus roseus]